MQKTLTKRAFKGPRQIHIKETINLANIIQQYLAYYHQQRTKGQFVNSNAKRNTSSKSREASRSISTDLADIFAKRQKYAESISGEVIRTGGHGMKYTCICIYICTSTSIAILLYGSDFKCVMCIEEGQVIVGDEEMRR